jgi:hypothetical protein
VPTPRVEKTCAICQARYLGYAHAKNAWCRGCYHNAYQKANKHRFKRDRLAERERSRQRRLCPKHKASIRAIKRKARTGFTADLVERLRDKQKGFCALCTCVLDVDNRPSLKGESADHCHTTKSPRGLLCSVCNRTLGWYEKHQRPAGLVIEPYEAYLANPPAKGLL